MRRASGALALALALAPRSRLGAQASDGIVGVVFSDPAASEDPDGAEDLDGTEDLDDAEDLDGTEEPWETDWWLPDGQYPDFGAVRGTIPDRPLFTVLGVNLDLGRCCPSPFFRLLMEALKAHPLFRKDPLEAEVVFFFHDTLRMCEWPHLQMAIGEEGTGHDIGCVDAGGDGVPSWKGMVDDDHSCDWCCPASNGVFFDAVDSTLETYGKRHTFVYFKNSGDTFFECEEFGDALDRCSQLDVPIRFVGFQLQWSQFERDDEMVKMYGVPGVNLLVPLLAAHIGMEEPDDIRELCTERKYLASFSGQLGYSPIRRKVFDLKDDPLFHIYETDGFGHQDPEGYEEVLRNSVFGFVPRGDEHYTFRLTEVLAAGAVPVMIDDDFVSPYGTPDIWEWAVPLPESEVHTAAEVLGAFSPKEVCEMKKKGTRIWHYAKDVGSTVDGMLAGLARLIPSDATVDATTTTTTVPKTTASGAPTLTTNSSASTLATSQANTTATTTTGGATARKTTAAKTTATTTTATTMWTATRTTTTTEEETTTTTTMTATTSPSEAQSVLDAAGAALGAIARLRFAVVDEDPGFGACCASPFFKALVDTLRGHPDFTPHVTEAHVVFFRHDTLRMCEWPRLAMKKGAVGDLGCIDADKEEQDDDAADNEDEDEDFSQCGWCCPAGTDVFMSAVRRVVKSHGSNHTFVYFKNAQDNFFECHEFVEAKVRTVSLQVDVRFVGFQLQMSQLTEPANDNDVWDYPIPGVNLLVPLLPSHAGMEEPPTEREECRPRKYLASFSGQLGFSPMREKVFELDGKHEAFHIYKTDGFGNQDPEGYEEVLRESVFGFVPRGDEHYTFRLTEVLAAGAVPVVIDDDFVAPYGMDDLEKWAVRIPEDQVALAPMILDSLPNSTRCEMKKSGAAVWDFARDLNSTVAGMLQGLRLSSAWRPGTRTLTATSSASATQQTTTSESDRSIAAPGGSPPACLVNGGFEDGDFGEVPAHWRRSRGSSGFVSDEQRRSGSKSVKFTGSGWQLIETGPPEAESLNVSSATRYTLSFWARASEAGDAVRTEFLVYPDFSSSSWHDHQLATASSNGCIKFHAAPDAERWTRFAHEFIAAETSSAVRLSIGANSVRDMYVDDVVFSAEGADPPADAVMIASGGGGDTASEGNSKDRSEGQSASTVERVLVSVSVVLTLLAAGAGAAMSTNLLSRCGTHVAKCRASLGLGGSPAGSDPAVLEYVDAVEDDSTSGEPLLGQGGAAPADLHGVLGRWARDADAALRGWWQRFSSWASQGGRSLAPQLGEEGSQEEGRQRGSDAAPSSKASEDTPHDADSKDDEASQPRSRSSSHGLGSDAPMDPEAFLGPRPKQQPRPPPQRPSRWEQFRADRDAQRSRLKMPKDRPDLPGAARQPPHPRGHDRWRRVLEEAGSGT